jgi:predicted nucleic-acid-binding Zn-ribbon protein/peroxiredoxin
MTTTAAAISIGSPAPDEQLARADGSVAQISSLWRERPLILSFLGDPDSEFTADNAAQLRDADGAFDQAGAALAAILPAAPHAASAFAQEYNLHYALYCDLDRSAYAAFGVSPERPGTFVIDTSGVVRYVHRNDGVLDAPSTWQVAEAVAQITGAKIEKPEMAWPATDQDVPASPAEMAHLLGSGRPVGAGGLAFTCPKCGNNAYDSARLATSGGWLSRLFNFQYRNFTAVTCTNCRYTELYKTEGGTLANIADILAGQ